MRKAETFTQRLFRVRGRALTGVELAGAIAKARRARGPTFAPFTKRARVNLVCGGTRDERVCERLSSRMKDRFDILGSLPDVIDDDLIEDIESLDSKLTEFIEKKHRANAFDIRYADTVDPDGEPWEKCAQVLSRRDIVERLSRGQASLAALSKRSAERNAAPRL